MACSASGLWATAMTADTATAATARRTHLLEKNSATAMVVRMRKGKVSMAYCPGYLLAVPATEEPDRAGSSDTHLRGSWADWRFSMV